MEIYSYNIDNLMYILSLQKMTTLEIQRNLNYN